MSSINTQLKVIYKHKAYIYKQLNTNKYYDGTIRDYSLHMYYINELSNIKHSIHVIYNLKDTLKNNIYVCFKGYDLSVYTVEELYRHLHKALYAVKNNGAYPYSPKFLATELIAQGEYEEDIAEYTRLFNTVY